MLECKDASRLLSESLDRRLSLRERLAVRLHLLICEACTRFSKQVAFLHRAAREYLRRGAHLAERLTLSSESRERIRRALADGGS